MSFHLGKVAQTLFLASSLYDAIEDHDFSGVLCALTEKNADPNIILPHGIAPLHLALGNDDLDFALLVTKLIMQHGGNPNLRTEDGLSPLHIAAAWGHLDLVELLICCGADPEVRDYCNLLPIDYASENKHKDVTLFLHYVSYSGSTFAELQDEPVFNLTLDKVIVYNGVAEAQYDVDKSAKLSVGLEQLPRVSSVELVENWCSKHVLRQATNETVSQTSSNFSPPDTRFVNCKPRNARVSVEFERSPRFSNSYKYSEVSPESGIAILPEPDDDVDLNCLAKRSQDVSSDYFTCNEISGSTNILERNIVETLSSSEQNVHRSVCSNDATEDVTNDIFDDFSKPTECSHKEGCLDIVEVYKYSDEQQGVVLFENRLLVNPKSNVDVSYQSQSSKLTSLPASFDYDTDTLRCELRQHGFCAGPITKTTKRVYLRKLYRMKKTSTCMKQPKVINTKVYSTELEQTLIDPTWFNDLTVYKSLEQIVSKDFNNPDVTRRWREGINKSSFTYLLLDPRITNNLPVRRDSISLEETWRTFVSSIFYVGKGKRSRPYAHLYEAVLHWNKNNTTISNTKLEHILDIWNDNSGVVCLHVFQNVIPCEAYTREAAMIKALKLENIDNKKFGDFYGTACTWTSKQQKMFGVLLLHKAMLIFLNEGERQLKPADIN